jgi:glutathione S-transferase
MNPVRNGLRRSYTGRRVRAPRTLFIGNPRLFQCWIAVFTVPAVPGGETPSSYFVISARIFAPEAERQNWSAGQALSVFESRLGLVTRQLARSPYLAGERFTAADISVVYALELARRYGGFAPGEAEQAYMARTTGRDAYKRALERSQAAMGRTPDGGALSHP